MLRFALPSLLLISVLSAPAAMAQQNSKKAPAPTKAAMPAAATPAPAADGFAAPPARVVEAPAPQSEGFSIAPGFTAAPSRRVNTDYRGRVLAPYVRRNVREAAPVAAPMPAPEPVAAPEPEPVAMEATAPAAKKSTGTATKKATPAKKAPAKKPAADGWGSGGSGW